MFQKFQLYSYFISYSTQGQPFAARLYADLRDKGVCCWIATGDLQSGKKLNEQIEETTQSFDWLPLILFDSSMNSEWVNTEITNARQKEVDQNKRVLFPISLVPFETIRACKNFDADTGKDSGREIQEYYIPDFGDWKNQDKISGRI